MRCTTLELQQAGAEVTLTETTCGGKRNNRRKKRGMGDAGCTDLAASHPSVVQGEMLQHNRAVQYTDMARWRTRRKSADFLTRL